MFDLHTHSTFSDGRHSPREMVEEAIRRGMSLIGLSDHSHADWDEVSMPLNRIDDYRRELARLRQDFGSQIEIRCGLERDYYSDDFRTYDYVIGSVHAVRMTDGYYFSVDWDPDMMEENTRKYFGGDWYALTEAYFALEENVAARTQCDIIGHFDLVSKYNEQRRWFDPEHPRYRAAWKKAADALLRTGKPFEVNTGAISRGCRTDAYPAKEIRTYIREKGGRFLLSSDAHQKENIGYQFERFFPEIGMP